MLGRSSLMFGAALAALGAMGASAIQHFGTVRAGSASLPRGYSGGKSHSKSTWAGKAGRSGAKLARKAAEGTIGRARLQ